VLIVDDCRDTTTSLSMLLHAWGHQPVVANSGQAALQAMEPCPDVVLLDIGLPDMNGWEVASRMRAMPGGGEMMLVVISGYGQPDDRSRSYEVGCDAHLLKPADPELLRQLLAGRAAERKEGV